VREFGVRVLVGAPWVTAPDDGCAHPGLTPTRGRRWPSLQIRGDWI